MKKRRALRVALAVVAILAVATEGVFYRRQLIPWRSFTTELNKGPGRQIRFAGDDGFVVVAPGAANHDVRSIETGSVVRSIKGSAVVGPHDVLFFRKVEPDGIELVSAETGGATAIPDVTGGSPLAIDPRSGRVALLFNGTGVEVRSIGAREGTMKLALWSFLQAGLFARSDDRLALQGHGGNGDWITLVSIDSAVVQRHWNAELLGFAPRGEIVARIPSGDVIATARDGTERKLSPEPCKAAALSASGERLAMLFEKTIATDPRGGFTVHEKIQVWILVIDTETGAIVRRVVPRSYFPRSLALTRDGDKLAVLFEDGPIEVWEIP